MKTFWYKPQRAKTWLKVICTWRSGFVWGVCSEAKELLCGFREGNPVMSVRRQEFITVCMSLEQSLWVTDFFFIGRVLWLSCFYFTLSFSPLKFKKILWTIKTKDRVFQSFCFKCSRLRFLVAHQNVLEVAEVFRLFTYFKYSFFQALSPNHRILSIFCSLRLYLFDNGCSRKRTFI